MTVTDIREAARRCRGRARTEISGGVSLERIPELASTGADFVFERCSDAFGARR